jgi:4-aminobutyrate aminotransferase-like enzyme
MLAIMTDSAEIATEIILASKDSNLILFWLLFEPRAIRITPPLTITETEIREGCAILAGVLDKFRHK